MIDQPILGPTLEPPRGGMLRLQQSVRRVEIGGIPARNWLAIGVAASVAALALLFVVRSAVQQRRIQFTVEQALSAPPQTQFDNSAYVVLPSRNPQVQIFLIGSLSPRLPATEDKNGA